jgi:hypothetical protein
MWLPWRQQLAPSENKDEYLPEIAMDTMSRIERRGFHDQQPRLKRL